VKQRSLSGIEWIVHAVACAEPNLRLRRLLEQRGFVVRDLPDVGKVYHLYQPVGEPIDGSTELATDGSGSTVDSEPQTYTGNCGPELFR
jgi:hypothetical protein